MLEIKVGDARCPSGAPVAILDVDGQMLSCFAAVTDAIRARGIMDRGGLAIDADVPGKIGHLTDPESADCDDPDDPLDPTEDPEDCCDGDPDGEYYKRWVL
jgi:hypothetical protein